MSDSREGSSGLGSPTVRKLGANGLPRRRNGKQQACEPCRKAKIACDHSLPVCERCRRRKVSDRCVYVDAPMTKGLDGSGVVFERQSAGPRPASGGRKGSKRDDVDGSERRESSGAGHANGGGERREEDYGNAKPVPESGPFIKSGGFFGPTNFSAVFLENQERLGNDAIQLSSSAEEASYIPSYESLQPQSFLMLSRKGQGSCVSPRIALGAKVLAAFPDRATCQFLLDRYTTKGYHCIHPKESVVATASSLWSTFPSAMRFPRRPADLEVASTLLCANAEKALEEFEDYQSWLMSCTGANLRWEVVGQVYGAFAGSILSLSDKDPFFGTQEGERRSRRHFSVEMKECVQACVTLSNYMDLINLSMVGLLMKNLVLQTVISGDACLVVWRQLGDLISATTALGLHRQPVTDDQPDTFLSEMKRRSINAVLGMCLGNSLLTGRPPALSYRSTRFKLPLCVSDEVLMQGEEKIREAKAKLDPNGWPKEVDLCQGTMMRARGMMAPVLSEVLELYLGDAEDCTAERIHELLNRTVKIYDSIPYYLHFKHSDLSTVPDLVFWRRLCLRLSILEHRLLLERLAHKHHILDGQSMVDCAREMLELTVLLWVQRDRFQEFHHDYDWMLMCWGIPSSGVLCVELVKEIKDTEEKRLRLPRSEIVQNLSLLIGFLDWIKPAAGNYQLCMRMRVIIKRILDQILNPSPTSSAPEQAKENGSENGVQVEDGPAGSGNGIPPYDPALFEGGGYGYTGELDNFDWLNNVDWSRGPWIDLGQDVSNARWN